MRRRRRRRQRFQSTHGMPPPSLGMEEGAGDEDEGALAVGPAVAPGAPGVAGAFGLMAALGPI